MRFSLFPVLLVVVIAFAASCCSAKEEVVITSFDDMWKGAFAKVVDANLRGQTDTINVEKAIVKFTGMTTSAKKLESAIAKVTAGAKLKPLDTTTTKWKTAFEKLKASGQRKNVNEAQAAKITEGVAQELVKNPSKWRYVKKALVITFGVGLTGLIIVGFNVMLSP